MFRAKVVFGLIITTLLLSSCASYWVRQECDKVNWFEHGRKIALSGRRVTGDELVVRCAKAEANIDSVSLDRGFKTGMETYCQPETVFQVGKRGEFFSSEMCDGEQPRLLKKKHEEGVLEYCRRTNGYAAGAVGNPYNGICPKNLENDFLPEFNRGRKAYLTTQITNTEGEIQDLDREISELSLSHARLSGEVAAMNLYILPISNDPAVQAQRENMRMRQQDLQMQADQVTYRLNQKRE